MTTTPALDTPLPMAGTPVTAATITAIAREATEAGYDLDTPVTVEVIAGTFAYAVAARPPMTGTRGQTRGTRARYAHAGDVVEVLLRSAIRGALLGTTSRPHVDDVDVLDALGYPAPTEDPTGEELGELEALGAGDGLTLDDLDPDVVEALAAYNAAELIAHANQHNEHRAAIGALELARKPSARRATVLEAAAVTPDDVAAHDAEATG